MNKDKNGFEIKMGDTVLVPDPTNDDLWLHSFAGQVNSFRGNLVCVVDGDGDCWDVEPERLVTQE